MGFLYTGSQGWKEYAGSAYPLSRNDHVGVPAVDPATSSAIAAQWETAKLGEFAAHNKDLLKGKVHVPKEYYRGETLKPELARKTFILPARCLALSQKCGV